MSVLARRLCQPCCGASAVRLTAVRTVRKRAARVVLEDGSSSNSHVPGSHSVLSSTSPSTLPSSSSTTPHSLSSSLSPPASSLSPPSSSLSPPSSSLSPPSSSSLTSTCPDSLVPPAQPHFPRAVYGLTEKKLQELAAYMPPVLTSRENVVQPPTWAEPVKKVKKSPKVTEETQERVLADLYTPLWRIPYNLQLQEKEKKAGIFLKKLKKRIFNVYGLPLPEELPRLPCPLHPILPAPAEQEYRSEDTFAVWRGLDGNPKTVGLLTGNTKTEGTVCLPPSSLISVKAKHKLFCQAFQDFIRQSSHPSFLDYHQSRGVWRSVTVRTTDRGDTTASVSIFPHLIDEEGVRTIEEELRQYFLTGPGAGVGLASLYLQVSETTHRCRHKAPYRQVFGPPQLEQTCAGVACRVLPGTALPVNPPAEELVVSSVLKAAGMSSSTNLLFVGAASGHLCLPLARSVGRAVCVESSPSAAEDASANMAHNDVHNVTLSQGSPEKVLPEVLPDLKSLENVVAVVDCGDKALHPQVVVHLRKTRAISQLVLLTTKPEGFVLANCASFANKISRNKLSKYNPLLPVLAFTVDHAPHTHQFTMGVLMSRDEYIDVSPHRPAE